MVFRPMVLVLEKTLSYNGIVYSDVLYSLSLWKVLKINIFFWISRFNFRVAEFDYFCRYSMFQLKFDPNYAGHDNSAGSETQSFESLWRVLYSQMQKRNQKFDICRNPVCQDDYDAHCVAKIILISQHCNLWKT